MGKAKVLWEGSCWLWDDDQRPFRVVRYGRGHYAVEESNGEDALGNTQWRPIYGPKATQVLAFVAIEKHFPVD